MSALTIALAAHPVLKRDPPLRESPPPVSIEIPPTACLQPPEPEAVKSNEHLAVLLPKHLWKPDNLASCCDNFFCRATFTLFERRHHCRKCGGVFCKRCSDQVLPLLDTSQLDFLHPPRNVPIAQFESEKSPIVPSRVCDDCWDQIHGCPSTPRTPDLVHSSPISMLARSVLTESGNSSLSSAPSTPPDAVPRRLRTTTSSSSLRSTARATFKTSRVTLPEPERSYGELDAYPLRRASLLCKATGGGRWEPKQPPVLVGYRVPVPGGKAPYELQLEREAELERLRRENPIIRDGEFQYRFPRDPEPAILSRTLQLSTF